MSTDRNASNEATSPNTATAKPDASVQGAGSATIVGIQISVDPLTDKFVFSQDAPKDSETVGAAKTNLGERGASAPPPTATPPPAAPKPSASGKARPPNRYTG